jgi:putative ATPase
MSDLFAPLRAQRRAAAQPLAARMRPKTLDEFVGQEHILGEGKMLRRLIVADRLTSLIFYGPPGVGKTTLAQLIAAHTKARFVELNATATGVKEVRDVLTTARAELESTGTRTVLFLDEIHRFNRAQQDIFLGDVESGAIILVGATTENPFFAVNSPLVSRSQIFQFEPLTREEVRKLIERAVADPERGYGNFPLTVEPGALDVWMEYADGDARRALTALEIAVLSSLPASGERLTITAEIARESIQKKALVYDQTGDEHYDTASAFIKSMRGSDPDAAIYWLARMLAAGDDPRFIARRIAILASEDIGNADPQAIVVAAATLQIVEFIGLPEAQLTLAQAVTYMAGAPKSNASYVAINEAMADVKTQRTIPVPRPLRDSHYRGSATLGHSGYQYPHDDPRGFVDQTYLGVDKHYYRPTERGYEALLAATFAELRRQRTPADGNETRDQIQGTPPDPKADHATPPPETPDDE